MSGYGGGRGSGDHDGYGSGARGGAQGGRGGQRGQGKYPRTGGQSAQRGTGGQSAQRGSGTGPRPAQRGGDPRAADSRGGGPRRVAGGYEDQYQAGGYPQPGGSYGQGGYGNDGDDSFLPGFGRRDQGGGYDDGYGGRPDPRANPPRPGGPRDGRGPGGGGRRPDGRGPNGQDRGRDPRARDNRDREAWTQYHGEKRRRGVVRRLAPWVALLVIVVPLAIGGLYVYHKYEARYHPADYSGPGTGDVTVEVKSGDNAFSLAPRLVQLGVTASDRAFTNAAEAAPAGSTGLEAGFYTLHHHMQASLAWAALLSSKNRVQKQVTVVEGKRASQIALILAKDSGLPAKDFQQIIAHPAQLGLPSYANGKAEGYLFPATYPIVPHETALQILQAMVNRFKVEAAAVNLPVAAKAVGLTPAQVITEASMAQAEAGSKSDYPKIAEVIYNRLKINMLLRFDSTVLYGLGKYGVSASFADLRVNTPYNTYLHLGLPIGPISNPGDLAIKAVLHPDTGDLLYFLTKPGGASEFSHTCLPGQC